MKQFQNNWENYLEIVEIPENMAVGVVSYALETAKGERGNKVFELSNHLGNVLATVSDKKLGRVLDSTSLFAAYYEGQVRSAQDYYAFGWGIPSRSFSSGNYRFGFNGKEDDSDYGEQLIQDYGFRIYNPSVGRFLSVDPITTDYPELTPYQFASNTPIQAIDLDGLEAARPLPRSSPQMRVVTNNIQMRRALRPMNNSFESNRDMMRRSGNLIEGGIDEQEQEAINRANKSAFVQMGFRDINRENRILREMADNKTLSAPDLNYYNKYLANRDDKHIPKGTILPIYERVKKLFERLDQAEPASSPREALELINKTLDSVEDDYSGVEKNSYAHEMPNIQDGRMYGVLDDKFVRVRPDGSIRAFTRKNVIITYPDGSLQIYMRDRVNKENDQKGKLLYQKEGQKK